MADFTPLDAALTALADEELATEQIDTLVETQLSGQQAAIDTAVTAALDKDNAADGNSIAAAKAAIADASAKFAATRQKLSDALNPPAPAGGTTSTT